MLRCISQYVIETNTIVTGSYRSVNTEEWAHLFAEHSVCLLAILLSQDLDSSSILLLHRELTTPSTETQSQ